MYRMVMWLILLNHALFEQDAQDAQDGDVADPVHPEYPVQ